MLPFAMFTARSCIVHSILLRMDGSVSRAFPRRALGSHHSVPMRHPQRADRLSERCPLRPMVLIADGAGRYISSGVIQISVTNLAIIVLMMLVFVLAIVLPFPGRHHDDSSDRDS